MSIFRIRTLVKIKINPIKLNSSEINYLAFDKDGSLYSYKSTPKLAKANNTGFISEEFDLVAEPIFEYNEVVSIANWADCIVSTNSISFDYREGLFAESMHLMFHIDFNNLEGIEFDESCYVGINSNLEINLFDVYPIIDHNKKQFLSPEPFKSLNIFGYEKNDFLLLTVDPIVGEFNL